MVNSKQKSRSFRRVKVKTITGNKTHYTRKNRGIAKCAITGKPLNGIPRMTNRKFKNLNLSKKRVSRAYGGYMSHTALKEKIMEEMVLK